ncbi:motile sperm domain-containing protein 2-like protein [Dinothrombium tinctorium]|uniref:Motile sperm domain-containing protein 2-like protein n=1 Tax=Dinothrombium tinctorium TaxID=1965070 RepID=A0A443R8C9_9ACAR|nr:motile sperm domain-containing protein 2-like protein [Dinothrombium tinctorium]
MSLKDFGVLDEKLVFSTRSKFLQNYQKEADSCYAEDIQKVLQDDWFIKRFLILTFKNEDKAVNMLINALKWRKMFGLRTFCDNYFPAELFKIGALFLYEEDINGLPTLYIRISMLKKVPEITEILRQFLIYHIFKIDEKADGTGWTIIADFTNCGYSAYEHLDELRFVIFVLHHYFPAGVDCVIVHHLPWVLKALWNVVRYWIPAKKRKAVKFTSGDQIYQYVKRENLPDFMGGTCDRDYKKAPMGCPTARDFGIEKLGLNEETVKKIINLYKEYL